MSLHKPIRSRRRNGALGRLEIVASDADMGAAGLRGQLVEWRPDRRRLRHLPQAFTLPLKIVQRPDGLRQILPQDALRQFLQTAAVGGLAIGIAESRFTREERQSHRLMLLLFQWSHSDRRLAKRSIRRAEDLYLRRSERGQTGEADVLPAILLPGSKREATRLTPQVLLERGLHAARENGRENPSIHEQIDFGLLAAAWELPPKELPDSPDRASQWLRIGLFGLDQPHVRVSEEERTLIEERLISAVQRHWDLDTESFRNWLWRDVDNLIQQISQRARGGRTSRQAVRSVLHDLLWQSYTVVSECVRLQLRTVRTAIDPPLSQEELRTFENWYERQLWLAEWLPVMLHHRLGLLLPTLDRLEHADGDLNRIWAAFLQAIYWSSEMTERRRQADRDQKHGLRRETSLSISRKSSRRRTSRRNG